MTTATPEKTDGLKALQTAIEEIDKTIQDLGGVFKIQMAVRQFLLILVINAFYLKTTYTSFFSSVYLII